ncbi:MAG: M15 family metallopeptidase, partial [Pseudomonadota bacterium]
GIVVDLMFYGSDNFVGEPIDGYGHPYAVLSKAAARALAKVQTDLVGMGLGLKVFDAYRPQRAVDHFVRWSERPDDLKAKAKHYPNVAKVDLHNGYIARRSEHSRGSAVDLTIVYWEAAGIVRELDMGTPIDFFDPASWPSSRAVSPQQRANRALLRSVMMLNGFVPYFREWWHFRLKDEPFPDTYFDFPL